MSTVDGLEGSWNFFRAMAFVVGTALAVLSFVALPWVYVLGHEKNVAYTAAWTAHGWLFPVYLIAAFLLSQKLRWSFSKTAVIMIAGTVPLASFFAEAKVRKEVQPLLTS
jgi:integral membrane protein